MHKLDVCIAGSVSKSVADIDNWTPVDVIFYNGGRIPWASVSAIRGFDFDLILASSLWNAVMSLC